MPVAVAACSSRAAQRLARSSSVRSLVASAAVLGALAATVGCEGGRLQNPRTVSTSALVTLDAPGRAKAAGLDATTTEVRSTFAQWLNARSVGDAAAYESLYDTVRFEGVRRTSSGMEKRLRFADWQSEQRAAVRRGEAPRISRPVFESWPGGTLDAATASVAFDEESAAAAYGRRLEDGVRRVLIFGRSSDGKLRIVREELGVASWGLDTPSNTLSRDAKVARAME